MQKTETPRTSLPVNSSVSIASFETDIGSKCDSPSGGVLVSDCDLYGFSSMNAKPGWITAVITEPGRQSCKQKNPHASPASRASHCYVAFRATGYIVSIIRDPRQFPSTSIFIFEYGSIRRNTEVFFVRIGFVEAKPKIRA